jgi:hypothetical protein
LHAWKSGRGLPQSKTLARLHRAIARRTALVGVADENNYSLSDVRKPEQNWREICSMNFALVLSDPALRDVLPVRVHPPAGRAVGAESL